MPATTEIRVKFFDDLFGNDSGYLCIATKNINNKNFQQKFFKFPEKLQEIEAYIQDVQSVRDVYFCINLLHKPERTKENCKPTNLLWADLDSINPFEIELPPAVVIESSPGRYQGIWRLTMQLPPEEAEILSKRVAYAFDADKSGWDLTQLLRVPFTKNHKYPEKPTVDLLRVSAIEIAPVMFEALPAPPVENPTGSLELVSNMPAIADLPPFEEVLLKYKSATLNALITQEPGERDWSRLLWKLIHTAIELGMDDEEVLVVCRNSNCDKYDRDNRPVSDLWRDIQKARAKSNSLSVVFQAFKPLTMPILVDPDEVDDNTFITKYHSWGIEATDAIPEYHNLAAFMLVSAICANSVRLETSYGTLVPNLWGLLLGDSTLTRKTTSQRMVMDILSTVDRDCIVATEGSAEGLLTALEQRPNKTSVFFKDEVSGFFDSMNRKDYLAGMTETLTALYDVPNIFTRRLRKETIRIEAPAFIFFGGGVKDKVYDTISENYVLSGFLPRFLIVSGEADLSKLRRTGPNTDAGVAKRAAIVSHAADMYEHYGAEVAHKIGGEILTMPPRIVARLDDAAWERYGEIEGKMVDIGQGSFAPSLALPTFERLSRSLLKMAMCLAASRQEPINDILPVTAQDITNAAFYVQNWGWYSIEVIMNANKGPTEKVLDRILTSIGRTPGIRRSDLMQIHHLDKKNADLILSTLEERMLVRKESAGRGYRYWIAS